MGIRAIRSVATSRIGVGGENIESIIALVIGAGSGERFALYQVYFVGIYIIEMW